MTSIQSYSSNSRSSITSTVSAAAVVAAAATVSAIAYTVLRGIDGEHINPKPPDPHVLPAPSEA